MSMAIVHQLVLIVGLLAVGYACRRLGLLDEVAGERISRLLMNVTIPATAIGAAIGRTLEQLPTLLVFFAVAVALFVAVPLIGRVLCRLFKWGDVYRLMLVFGNTGFVGIPVTAAVLGQESVFYTSMFMLVFNFAFFTWGVATMKRAAGYDGGGRVSPRELLNPGIVSATLAILIFALQLPVPADVTNLLDALASINTPLAMMVIGASLASVPVKDIFNDRSLYQFVAVKMVAFPAILLASLKLLGVDPLLVGVFVILECMPVAANLSMAAIQYHGDINLVSKATGLTTLVFIPLVIAWAAVLGIVG